jgi:hypothetical protein
MAEEGETHPVHIPFKAKDESSGVIGKIAERTKELGHHADETIARLTEMGSALAGIGGALGFERMVETGKESLEQVSKLSKLTGTSADNVAALRDVFEQSGLQAEQLGTTITAISKKSLAMEEGSKGIVTEAKRWGVELDKGPVRALISMSKAVKENKLDMAGVAKLTRTSGETTGAMMDLLKKGPEELQDMIEHAKKLNVHLGSPEALERFEKFHEASTKIHEAFRRISEKVVVALAPALSKMSDKFSHWIDTINVNKFIDPLVKGMTFVVAHAKQLAHIMAANAILMRTTGMGLTGGAMKIGGAIFRGGAALGGRFGGGLGGFAGGLAGQLKGTGGATGLLGGLLGPLQTLVPIIFRVIGGITGLGAVAAAVYVVIKHFDLLKEKLGGVARAIWASIQKLWSSLEQVFSEDSAIGKFVRWIGDKFIGYLQFVGTMVSKLIDLVATAISWIGDAMTALAEGKSISKIQAERSIKASEERAAKMQRAGLMQYLPGGSMEKVRLSAAQALEANKDLTRAQRVAFQQYMRALQESGIEMKGVAFERFKERYQKEAKAPEATAAPSAGIYQDFRNSRFEIEQKFAEGFDPDRIAVGFANDVAMLGERRLASMNNTGFVNR